MQNCGMPLPPFVTWADSLSAQTVGEDPFFWPSPNLGPKTGLNLSEDLFFWFSPDFGLEIGLILGGRIFILVFIILKFPEFSVPPPTFENPAYATDSVMNIAQTVKAFHHQIIEYVHCNLQLH